MASDTRDKAASDLDDHENSIEALHRKLAAAPGVHQQRLQSAVDKLKVAYGQFREDALGCMN